MALKIIEKINKGMLEISLFVCNVYFLDRHLKTSKTFYPNLHKQTHSAQLFMATFFNLKSTTKYKIKKTSPMRNHTESMNVKCLIKTLGKYS